jgi:hypothetical protein
VVGFFLITISQFFLLKEKTIERERKTQYLPRVLSLPPFGGRKNVTRKEQTWTETACVVAKRFA